MEGGSMRAGGRVLGAWVETDEGSKEALVLLGGKRRVLGLLCPDWSPALQTLSARLTRSAAAQQQCS